METSFNESSINQKYYVSHITRRGDIRNCLSIDSAKTYSYIEAVNECSILNKTSPKFYRPVPHNIIIKSKLNDLD